MAKHNECWGIEVGANAIKAIKLAKRKDGVALLDYDVVPFKKVLTTPDIDVDESIQVNLDQFLSRHNMTKSQTLISVPGHTAFARFAKLPPVDPKRIADIVRFEAGQQIPFPIEQVEWDYQVFSETDSPDVSAGIFAITKDRVNSFLENYDAVGMQIHGLTLSPLAVYNGLAYDMQLDEESPGVIFMDIGSTSTDVIIVENGQLWLRTLAIGGNNFTDALIRAFKLSFPKAEKLKREASTSKYARQIFQAMRPVFADLVQEMQRSLGFYQSLNRDAKLTKIVGVGSTFKLPGMTKFLKQQLQLEIIRIDKFERLELEGKQEVDFSEHTLNMATAYGLALQGLDLANVSANLLPEKIMRQRLWKAKQPWMGAAAALMVAVSGAAATKQWTEQNAYYAGLEKSNTKVKQVTQQADKFVSRWKEIKSNSDPRQLIENLRRVLDYRDIWPKILLDLNEIALAMKPDPVLMTANYDAIAKIPRNQRRRVYIDSMDVEYLFSSGSQNSITKSKKASAFAGLSIDEIWGDAATGSSSSVADAKPITRLPTAASLNLKPPRFQITIRGTTPYKDGAKFVVGHLVNFLQSHAEREDRPYRVLPETAKLMSIVPVGDGVGNSANKISQSQGGLQAIGAAANPPQLGGGLGALLGGAKTRNQTHMTNNTKNIGDLDAIFPKRLTDSERRSHDWKFTVSWEVELRRPEKARQSEGNEQDLKRPQPALVPPPLKKSPAQSSSSIDKGDSTKTPPASDESKNEPTKPVQEKAK